MDRYLAMKGFVKVAQSGSFSRAAKDLGANQSSLSRLVQSLEEELGVQLLHRTTRQLRLTEPGTVFFAEASRIVADIDELTARTRELQTATRGHLRIGMPIAFGRGFVVPRLAEFHRSFPEVTLELLMDDRLVDVVREGFDVVIRIGVLPSSTHLSRKLAVVRRYLVAAPSLLQKTGRGFSSEHLGTLPAILFESTRSQSPSWRLTRERSRKEIPIRSHLSVNHLESILTLARDGLGVAHLPSWLVQSDLDSGRLERLLPEWSVASASASESVVHAVYPATRKQTAKVRAFIDFLVTAIAKDPSF